MDLALTIGGTWLLAATAFTFALARVAHADAPFAHDVADQPELLGI